LKEGETSAADAIRRRKRGAVSIAQREKKREQKRGGEGELKGENQAVHVILELIKGPYPRRMGKKKGRILRPYHRSATGKKKKKERPKEERRKRCTFVSRENLPGEEKEKKGARLWYKSRVATYLAYIRPEERSALSFTEGGRVPQSPKREKKKDEFRDVRFQSTGPRTKTRSCNLISKKKSRFANFTLAGEGGEKKEKEKAAKGTEGGDSALGAASVEERKK